MIAWGISFALELQLHWAGNSPVSRVHGRKRETRSCVKLPSWTFMAGSRLFDATCRLARINSLPSLLPIATIAQRKRLPVKSASMSASAVGCESTLLVVSRGGGPCRKHGVGRGWRVAVA